MRKTLVATIVVLLLFIGSAVPAGAARRRPGPVMIPTGALLDCIADIESEPGPAYRTGYTAVSRSGRYHGRYQFDRRTWAGVAARAGHHGWARRPANEAPPQVQDDAAGRLVAERGLQPWPTPRRRCR